MADFRLAGDLGDAGDAKALVAALHTHEADLPQRIAISRDGSEVFAYADDRAAADGAKRELASLAPDIEWTLTRWHHEVEQWEPADAPSESPAEEHAEREAEETKESQESGLAAWEVRVEFASHHDARAFAEREQAEGAAIVRRWKYVLIGLNDQDDAEALSKRLQASLPPGATLHVEPGSGVAWELMPKNPFAVFGGVGD